MMKTLRIVSVALLLALILAACSVIAPESSATVLYEGEPVAVPFKLGSTATETELTLVNTGEMQFQFAVSVSDNTNNWLQATTTQGWRTLDPEEEYPIILSHTCVAADRYEAVVVVEYSHVGRPNTTMRIPIVLDCTEATEAHEGIEVRFDDERLLDGNTIRLQAGQSGSAISVHNLGETKARVEVSLPGSPTWLRLNQTVHGPTALAGGESYTVPLEFGCEIGGTDSTTVLVTVDGNPHLEIIVTLSGCDVPAASLVFEIAGIRETQANFTPATNSQIIKVVNTSTTTPLQITSTFDDDNGIFVVSGAGTTTLAPGESQSLSVVAQCVAGKPDGAGFIHVEYDAAEPVISFPLLLTGCIEPEARLEVHKDGANLTSNALRVTATNGGPESTALTLKNVSLQDVQFEINSTSPEGWMWVSAVPGATYTLQPGEQQPLNVFYQCQVEAPTVSELTISIVGAAASRTIAVDLAGCATKPLIATTLDSEPIDDPANVSLDSTQTRAVLTLKNPSTTTPLEFSGAITSGNSWLHIPSLPSTASKLLPGASFTLPVLYTCPSAGNHSAQLDFTNGPQLTFTVECVVNNDPLYVSLEAQSVLNVLSLRAQQGQGKVDLIINNPSGSDAQVEYAIRGATGDWLAFEEQTDGTTTFTVASSGTHTVSLTYECKVGNLPSDYDSAEFVVKNNGVEEVVVPAFLLGCLDNPAEQVTLFIDDIEATAIRLAGQAPNNPLFAVENTGGEQITFTLDIIDLSVPDWIEVGNPYAGRITAQPGQKVPFTLVWDCTAPQPARSAKLTVNIIGGIIREFPINASACQ